MQSPKNWGAPAACHEMEGLFFNFEAFRETSRDPDFVQQASLARISEISVPSSKLKVNAGSFQLLLCHKSHKSSLSQTVSQLPLHPLSFSLHPSASPAGEPFRTDIVEAAREGLGGCSLGGRGQFGLVD